MDVRIEEEEPRRPAPGGARVAGEVRRADPRGHDDVRVGDPEPAVVDHGERVPGPQVEVAPEALDDRPERRGAGSGDGHHDVHGRTLRRRHS